MVTTCTNIPQTYVHTYRHMMREPSKEKEVRTNQFLLSDLSTFLY
jgi:hypothetical protein